MIKKKTYLRPKTKQKKTPPTIDDWSLGVGMQRAMKK